MLKVLIRASIPCQERYFWQSAILSRKQGCVKSAFWPFPLWRWFYYSWRVSQCYPNRRRYYLKVNGLSSAWVEYAYYQNASWSFSIWTAFLIFFICEAFCHKALLDFQGYLGSWYFLFLPKFIVSLVSANSNFLLFKNCIDGSRFFPIRIVWYLTLWKILQRSML